jgi:small subunit ribosomal protein S16
MAVRMRLRREGKKKQPFYRVVVADARAPRDGGFIEDIGYYQPLREPSTISIDRDRALHWLRNGVEPSGAVRNLLRIEGIWEEFRPGDPGKDRSAKHARDAAKAREKEQAARAAAEQAAAQRAEAEAALATDDAAEAAPIQEAPEGTVEQAAAETDVADAATAEAADGDTPGTDAESDTTEKEQS